MHAELPTEIAALPRLRVSELRARFAEVFGEPTPSHNKVWLVKRIAWRLQARAAGDLSERARRRAEELAADADLRLSAPPTIADALTGSPLDRRLSRFSTNRHIDQTSREINCKIYRKPIWHI